MSAERVEFTIKNKIITFKLSLAFTIISVAVAFMFALLIIICGIDAKVKFIWFIEVVPALSLGLSVFGLYVFYKEEFSLKDGEFRYIKIFKKAVSIKAESISRVYLRPFGRNTKIEFMNKRGEIAATVFDDGTVLQDGIFLETLKKLNIETVRRGYGDE